MLAAQVAGDVPYGLTYCKHELDRARLAGLGCIGPAWATISTGLPQKRVPRGLQAGRGSDNLCLSPKARSSLGASGSTVAQSERQSRRPAVLRQPDGNSRQRVNPRIVLKRACQGLD